MVRRFLLTIVIYVLWSAAGVMGAKVAPQDGEEAGPQVRQRLNLTGTWQATLDAENKGEQAAYYEPDHDTGGWRTVKVPASFANVAPETDRYEGIGWFRRTFAIPEAWRGKHIVLRFEGVNNQAKVWLNGRLVGENPDAFLGFELPVTRAVSFDNDNIIALRVDNTRRWDMIPGRQLGWHPYGGILREVELVATNLLRIEEAKISARPTNNGGTFTLQARIANSRDRVTQGRLEVDILQTTATRCASFTIDPVAVDANQEKAFEVSGTVLQAIAWAPEHPALYTAEVKLLSGDTIVDARKVSFGFRQIEAKNERLYLNGNPIFLTGFNRHEDSPATDMCPDHNLTRKELLTMKEMGCNFIRLCHYPQHPETIDMCDEIGLLVMCEIPLYMWRGLEDGKENYLKTVESAQRQLTRMIDRDYNHPAVIFWSVSNETHTQHPEVRGTNVILLAQAKRLDPTRLAVHVSDHWQPHYKRMDSFGEDDVICVNGYPDPKTGTKYWAEELDELHKAYPGKPILVTEFGGEGDKSEDWQVARIETGFAGMKAPYICGTTIWCWADHPWDKTWLKPPLSPYGVFTRDRHPRASVEAARKGFAECQRRFAEMQNK